MQKRPKAEVKRVTGPPKPPRLKAAKKQLQFESPLPRRTRAKQQDDELQKQHPQQQQHHRQKPADKVIAMPGSSQDADTDAAAEAAVDVPETEPEPVPWPEPHPRPHSLSHPDPGQLRVSHSQSSAAKKRLAEGCTSLMYACQRGDIVQVLAQMREKLT
uniref:Uncharacterized protein LOC108050567 n=1 Tax=Drosophila rhopaloa TaxID=1041015 RepID=A0A6P4FRI1_DRORH